MTGRTWAARAWLWAPLLALAWKGLWLARDAFPFHADEAVVALMARHILQGARPVFFYGQAYMGSLDAYLIAAGFWLLGQRVLTVRLVQAGLYALTVALSVRLVTRWARDPAAGAALGLLMAVPTVNLLLYTTITLGGYNEALLLGTLGLAVATAAWATTARGAVALGVLGGLGLWVNPLAGVYLLPAAGYALGQTPPGRRGRWVAGLLLGGLLGAAPWWWYGWQHGWRALALEVLGQAVMGTEEGPLLWRWMKHMAYLLLLGIPVIFGFRPPWDVHLLFPWGVVPALAGYALLARAAREVTGPLRVLPAAVIGATGAGFVFTAFGVDPSGRYFLPVTHMLFFILAAGWARLRLRHAWAAGFALAALMVYLGFGTVAAASQPYALTAQFAPDARIPPPDRPLQAFLEAHNLRTGYTTYWIAYPLAFSSGEALRFSPRLPYHLDLRYTPRDDRIPAYTRAACRAARPAYVVAVKQTALLQRLRAGFRAQGLTWREAHVGAFVVLYDLNRPTSPWELGLSPPPPEAWCEP